MGQKERELCHGDLRVGGFFFHEAQKIRGRALFIKMVIRTRAKTLRDECMSELEEC